MSSLAIQKQAFASQMTKAERDDARHADLHTNVKHTDLDDSDRIFLLKREIDNLMRNTLRTMTCWK